MSGFAAEIFAEECLQAGTPVELAPLLQQLGWPADKAQWPPRISASVLAYIDTANVEAAVARRLAIATAVEDGKLCGYYKTLKGDWLTRQQYAASDARAESYPYIDVADYLRWRPRQTPILPLLAGLLARQPPSPVGQRATRGAPQDPRALDKRLPELQRDAARVYQELSTGLGRPPTKTEVTRRLLTLSQWSSYSPTTLARNVKLTRL